MGIPVRAREAGTHGDTAGQYPFTFMRRNPARKAAVEGAFFLPEAESMTRERLANGAESEAFFREVERRPCSAAIPAGRRSCVCRNFLRHDNIRIGGVAQIPLVQAGRIRRWSNRHGWRSGRLIRLPLLRRRHRLKNR